MRKISEHRRAYRNTYAWAIKFPCPVCEAKLKEGLCPDVCPPSFLGVFGVDPFAKLAPFQDGMRVALFASRTATRKAIKRPNEIRRKQGWALMSVVRVTITIKEVHE